MLLQLMVMRKDDSIISRLFTWYEDVIATKPQEIVHILDNDQFSIETKKGFYLAIVGFLKVLKIPKELHNTSYRIYKDFLILCQKKFIIDKKQVKIMLVMTGLNYDNVHTKLLMIIIHLICIN